MNFIELCTQSDHPFAHKALEQGGCYYSYDGTWRTAWGQAARDATRKDESAVAWELQWELAERGKTLRILPNSTRESVYRDLLRAVEALEVE